MDEFFALQKEKNSLNKDINLIISIYNLGYPEKAKQKLYILLDQFDKKDFDQNIDNILNLLNKKNFDKSILNSISYIINNKKIQPLDSEILEIYKSKDDDKGGRSNATTVTDVALLHPQDKDDGTASSPKKEEGGRSNATTVTDVALLHPPKKEEEGAPLHEKIELAIVLSEWLDDLDMDNSIKYSLMMADDEYYRILYSYLSYVKNKNIKKLEKINKKSPLYYHFLISAYKEQKDKEKSLFYLNKLKQEFPYYLKYNRINL
jgi:hypothetical protein